MGKSKNVVNSRDSCIGEVYISVFYNSNYSRQNVVHVPLKGNKRWNSHRFVHSAVSDTQGTTEYCRPTSKTQCQKVEDEAGTVVANTHDTCQAANSDKVDEVGTLPLPKIMMTRTTTKVGPKIKGQTSLLYPMYIIMSQMQMRQIFRADLTIKSHCLAVNINLAGGVKTQLFPLLCLKPQVKRYCTKIIVLTKPSVKKFLIMTKMKTSLSCCLISITVVTQING